MDEKEMRSHRACFTGHRPEKLTLREDLVRAGLQQEIALAVQDGITTFITGMARGVDLWAAQLVMEAKKHNPAIMLICAIPYKGFEEKWTREWRNAYHQVLKAADFEKVFHEQFTIASFQERNRWMVDHSARVIGVYSGGRGGTYNTLAYAKGQGVQVRHIQG